MSTIAQQRNARLDRDPFADIKFLQVPKDLHLSDRDKIACARAAALRSLRVLPDELPEYLEWFNRENLRQYTMNWLTHGGFNFLARQQATGISLVADSSTVEGHVALAIAATFRHDPDLALEDAIWHSAYARALASPDADKPRYFNIALDYYYTDELGKLGDYEIAHPPKSMTVPID